MNATIAHAMNLMIAREKMAREDAAFVKQRNKAVWAAIPLRRESTL